MNAELMSGLVSKWVDKWMLSGLMARLLDGYRVGG